ncbi:interleukin 27 receptor alpha [Cricetulus griseus]
MEDTVGDFFPDAEANTNNLESELDEAVGSSEWLALTKSPQAFYSVKPDTPRLLPNVEFYEDESLEATVPWDTPLWPSHKVLICQFQYKRCQEKQWTQLEPQLRTNLMTPVVMQNLEPGTSYQVSGRCRVESGYPWGEWSRDLSFQTPFLAPESAPQDVVVSSIDGGPGLLVTWRQGTMEPWEYVVDWAQDGDSLDKLSWFRLPSENLSTLLPGDFEGGVPYRLTVTAVFPGGLAAAPSVWGFIEELVSSNTQTVTLPSLHWGSFELWVMVSTVAGQGPPGPSLWLHLPGMRWGWGYLPTSG